MSNFSFSHTVQKVPLKHLRKQSNVLERIILHLRRVRQNRMFILFVMLSCVLLSLGFYLQMCKRQTVISELKLRPSSNINYKLDTLKNDSKYDKLGNDTNKAHSSKRTFKKPGAYTRKKHLPVCLIIGVKKGGTGAVCEFMNINPNIACEMRERHFFDIAVNFNRGLEYYRSQMPLSYPNQITVEKSPGYFVVEKAVQRILAFNKQIKVILTLRHPIKRLISDYEHEKRHHHEPENSKRFDELVINETGGINSNYRPVYRSMYYIHLKMWLKYFPLEQIHIVDGDNFIADPLDEIEKIETFLGLPHKVTKENVYYDQTKGFYCHKVGGKRGCLMELKGHINNPIDPDLYHKLFDFYKGYNEKLFTLLGRTFKWDREY